MELQRSFLDNELSTHFPEDQALWQSWKDEFLDSGSFNSKTLFWYLSSGIDLMPLYYFGKYNTTTGFLEPDLFIYSDFGIVFNEPEILREEVQKGNQEQIPSNKGRFFLTGLIPLHWNHGFQPEDTIHRSMRRPVAFNGAAVYFLTIKQQFRDSCSENVPVLFIRKSNQFVFRYLLSKKIKVKYICTVSDGCRPDQRNRCPNNFYNYYMQVLEAKGFWITDHFNINQPGSMQKVADFEQWGHYDTHDKSYCFSRKYV